jgi:glycosyltransferase involved in cell wall biosynthesis
MHPKDPMGWDIRGIMLQTDLFEDVDYKLLPKEFEDSMVETETLNKIYNASDCFISTTLGEGWGLTYSEAASCKLPIIAPYSASFIEMSNYSKNAYMLENLYPICQINDNVIREQIDIFEAAETLNHVAMAKNKLLEDINAYENLTKRIEDNYKWVKSLEWSIVCKQWIEYFKIY